MIDYLETLAGDYRSWLIIVAAVICGLLTKEKPSRHAIGGAVTFVAAFSLFAMWKYAPSYTPIGEPDLESMNIEQMRAYILERREAMDVLWRQMEMYVWGVHVTATIYLSWVLILHIFPPHAKDLMAKWIVCILLTFEFFSLITDNTLCRFVSETKGSWLVDHMMYQGWVPSSCEVHSGPISDWWPTLAAVLFMTFAYVMLRRAKERMG